MNKPGKSPKADAPKSSFPGFTGVAFTTQASRDQGYSNFRVCTLFIVDGEIVHMEKTQEYAMFEVIARSEVFMNRAVWNLSSRYKDGDYQSLGGEQRDELVTRLKRENPELLAKIAPALCLKEEQTA